MIEDCLIAICAPTLAGVKFASLFNTQLPEEQSESQLRFWNEQMNPLGVVLRIVRRRGDRVLVYVYRPAQLAERLSQCEVRAFLSEYGYDSFNMEDALSHLEERLLPPQSSEFPHEIGIFLDYPLEDVIGFIHNRGDDYLLSGCWKVYAHPQETEKRFRKLHCCQDLYRRYWKKGWSVVQLTVAS